MSGLEALSLVCNILQIISAAHSTVSFCKAVYQGSSPDAHLGDNAVALASLSAEVEMFYASRQPPRTAHEKSLADVAKKCNIAARALEEEAKFLIGNRAKGNLATTIKIAVKTNWRKNRLDKLEKSLEAYQRTMESQLLAQVL
ncbi:hypothetical protein UCRPA7_592 [Phaeoacremonium minimum UCRPA7]|uniref:Uncharacterized protein n=1 Tax=Phaeoacremonium minimum (strain UCR-PA7) TaxID=1286976 RepID=R8BX13_PHAM7|nr:hypothetical protein UCRPA7_592 [Phaeoacremonium minimum UCRPA7]EOO03839.1 hypothetical protein UCRPA7_592 [Phaeoacremonium minimum UCRPA7]